MSQNDPVTHRYYLFPTALKYTSHTGKRCLRVPDGSFCIGGEVAFFVWEMVDTQTSKDLPARVHDYIIGTEGAVRIFLLVKLERLISPNGKRKQTVEGANTPVIDPTDDDLPLSRKLNTHVGHSRCIYNYTHAPSVDNPAEFEGTIKCLYQEQVHRFTNTTAGILPDRPDLHSLVIRGRYPPSRRHSPVTWSTRCSGSRSRSCMTCLPGPRHQSLLAPLGEEP